MLWSLALAGAGTALRTPYVSEAVMFAFPTIFALVGGAHQDYRYRRGSGGMLRYANNRHNDNNNAKNIYNNHTTIIIIGLFPLY
jgi:hypothetical protein